jgi:hypothetical protein
LYAAPPANACLILRHFRLMLSMFDAGLIEHRRPVV